MKCSHEVCPVGASFGLLGGKACRCFKHRDHGMINLKRKRQVGRKSSLPCMLSNHRLDLPHPEAPGALPLLLQAALLAAGKEGMNAAASAAAATTADTAGVGMDAAAIAATVGKGMVDAAATATTAATAGEGMVDAAATAATTAATAATAGTAGTAGEGMVDAVVTAATAATAGVGMVDAAATAGEGMVDAAAVFSVRGGSWFIAGLSRVYRPLYDHCELQAS